MQVNSENSHTPAGTRAALFIAGGKSKNALLECADTAYP